MSNRLADKVALITGGGSGIGAAMARRFVAEGALVFVADLPSAEGDAVARDIDARFVALDVADAAQWSATIERIVAEAGRIEVVCNNAGIVSNQSIADTTDRDWARVLAVNVTGVMHGCRASIAAMRNLPADRTGSIINTASTTSLLGLAFDAAYTTSKHAVLGLTRSVAAWCAEHKLPIRCNALHPGATRTAILQRHIDADPGMEALFGAMSPLGRMAEPDEIANLALFLASDESSYCTGGAFVADGGLTSTHPTM